MILPAAPRLVTSALAGLLLASGTAHGVVLEAGARAGAARVSVDPQGGAAAIYQVRGTVRLQAALPVAPESVPVPRGTVVDGFVSLGAGAYAVIHRTAARCGPLGALVRGADRVWRGEPVAGGASAATVAADPAGAPSVLLLGCGGEVVAASRAADGSWAAEATGARAARGAQPALAVGAGGLAVAGVAGTRPVLAVRAPGAPWRVTALPGGALDPSEMVTTLSVGIDPQGRAVAHITRGPRRPPDAASGLLAGVVSSLWRYQEGAWVPLPAASADPPVALVSAGQSYALLSAGGVLEVSGPKGTTAASVGRVSPAVGADGTAAFLTRARRPDLMVVRPAIASAGSRSR